ncbi:hypothetical protein [Vibrio tritonius]|uniref:hypothetical protein n=1 Tax=Vibrio tritonius TaxID=1435069 RepID=UPI000837D4E3|nr:hypothetical protein [Vibrio tritonius]
MKNWTVITQAVKDGSNGIMKRERYLVSTKNASHKETKIISLIGSPETSRRMAILGEQYKLYQQQKQKRGGRPLSSYAVEYCITLPKGISPTPQQWKSITIDCVKALAQVCNLSSSDYENYKKGIRAVLHQQNQNNSRGTGDHVHFIVSKVLAGKGVLTQLQKKGATRALKSAFTLSVLKHTNYSINDYTPLEIGRSKRLEQWKMQYSRVEQSKEELKLIRQLQNQVDKWIKAKEENDLRQVNRQYSRMYKTYEKLTKTGYSNEAHGTLEKFKEIINKNQPR